MYYTIFDTKLCEVVLIGDEDGIIRIHLSSEDSNRELTLNPEWISNASFFTKENR